MNNEPVAWRTHYPSGWEYKDGNPPFELKGNSQLLYTHPAKTPMLVLDGNRVYPTAKTLTDEEINTIADQFKEGEHWKSDVKWVIPESDFVEFAKAILRKAQEK